MLCNISGQGQQGIHRKIGEDHHQAGLCRVLQLTKIVTYYSNLTPAFESAKSTAFPHRIQQLDMSRFMSVQEQDLVGMKRELDRLQAAVLYQFLPAGGKPVQVGHPVPPMGLAWH
jgi:hypothetical protein